MIPLETFRELFDFNYWARDRQFQACAVLTPEQFLRPMGSSFASVRDTLAHLLAVEWVWLERWRGRSPNRKEAEAFGAGNFPTLDSIRDAWVPIEKGVRHFLTMCPEANLSRPLTYPNMQVGVAFAGEEVEHHLIEPLIDSARLTGGVRVRLMGTSMTR